MVFRVRAYWAGPRPALGALLKVFPGLVAVPALIWELSRIRLSRAWGFLAFLATLMTGSAGWFLLGGPQVLSSFQYHVDRGLEIETIYGGVIMAQGKLRGVDIPWVIEHKAVHLVPEWGDRFAAVAALVQFGALLLVGCSSGVEGRLKESASQGRLYWRISPWAKCSRLNI